MTSTTLERTAADVLAHVAHEMLQPLTAAMSALQLLRECPDEPIGQRAGVMVEEQFQRLSRFIDDLLEASRLQFGTTTLRVERVGQRVRAEDSDECARLEPGPEQSDNPSQHRDPATKYKRAPIGGEQGQRG